MVDEVKGMEEVGKDMDRTFLTVEKSANNGKYNIEDYAIAFVYGMGNTQRSRFKNMLKQGIRCGESVALNYGVDYDTLMNEVKRILNVEVNKDANLQ